MINSVTLLGYLGADPEVRTAQNGSRSASFRLATSETWTDKQTGDRKTKTEWHNIVIWNDKLVEIAERYLQKGSLVYIQGKLETRKWQDREGIERYVTEVVLKWDGKITLLPRGGKDSGDRADSDRGDSRREENTRPPARSQNELDDEIPFAPEWR